MEEGVRGLRGRRQSAPVLRRVSCSPSRSPLTRAVVSPWQPRLQYKRQVRHLKGILSSFGIEGTPTLAKAKRRKEEVEEAEELGEFGQTFSSTSFPGTSPLSFAQSRALTNTAPARPRSLPSTRLPFPSRHPTRSS